ncbi:hypothetical protein CONPUDRAFT_54531, partial [Coniophora puteana RWD-64-598 SS2]
VFVAVLAGSVDSHVMRAVRALLDFVMVAQYHSQTTETLTCLRQSLDNFHANKQIFITLNARTQDHFNIPKLHSLLHYLKKILALGLLDGLNTENTEWLHIDFAKKAWRGTNHKDYVFQMARWLQRRESVAWWSVYLDW